MYFLVLRIIISATHVSHSLFVVAVTLSHYILKYMLLFDMQKISCHFRPGYSSLVHQLGSVLFLLSTWPVTCLHTCSLLVVSHSLYTTAAESACSFTSALKSSFNVPVLWSLRKAVYNVELSFSCK